MPSKIRKPTSFHWGSYYAEIEDEKLESVISNDEYLKITEKVLKKYGGLWFNDESFNVSRKLS